MMIIVTGGTGALGRDIVENLTRLTPAQQIGVSVRDPGKAVDLTELGVRVRHGDFENPESLTHAFEGASQVLLVSSNAQASGGDPLAQHRTAIEAAKAAGAKRIVYTSQMASNHNSAFPPARDHAATEDMLRQFGLAWTALRHGFYASSAIQFIGNAVETGVLAAPADGKVAWTAHSDLAEAAARVLVDEGRFEGPTPPITTLETFDLANAATMLQDILGRPIVRKIIEDDELKAQLNAFGVPAPVVDISLGFYAASRAGEFSATDPMLGQLLGRAPLTLRDVLAAHLKAKANAA